ncbi:unnamed protein product [Rotaria sordida]|uniref:Uncharacterized protein n=1 Tax=Rotaria sordida TaxID=392033 RepID=A0A819V5B1_9BILA|nr:unnamed protein product [Rotaria sordida]CAF4100190.1 unnamed protein product [Rotaria sordida]
MINTGTGARPPWSCTRDVACSPIYFGSSIKLTSNEDFRHSSIVCHQEKQNVQENILKNKKVHFSNDFIVEENISNLRFSDLDSHRLYYS